MPCPSPRGDICPSAVNRQAGSRHRRIETSGPSSAGNALPYQEGFHALLGPVIVTPPTTAGTKRHGRCRSQIAPALRLVGTRWNMLADSGVPVMLTNRIYAAGQSVPYMSNPGAARFEAVPRKLW